MLVQKAMKNNCVRVIGCRAQPFGRLLVDSSRREFVDFAQISRDARDVHAQEIVQAKHMSFLREEYVVGKVLHNLCYYH